METDDRTVLRSWMEKNHQREREVWVATYRGRQPMAYALPYVAVVEEALCFGWIDSTCKRLPDGRLAQRLSPRRKNSHWTERNRERCRDLELLGLMTEAGRNLVNTVNKMAIDTTNMCSHLQRKLFDENGEYHRLWLAVQGDAELTAVVRSRQLHVYRNGKKVLVLAGKAAPKVVREDPVCRLLKKEKNQES